MHIIIVEHEHFEREWLVEILKKAFPASTITEFRNAGDFLLALGTLPTIKVIITEHFLPLGEPRPDHEEWFGNLSRLFPEATANWDYHEAAERLVRYMRKIGINIPIIIYTHSQSDWIDADVRKAPKVVYCEKRGESKNILLCVHKLLSIPV
jgi:hypothetical protein